MPQRYRMPIKRSPKSDPQQYRVYRMENEAIGSCRYAKLTRVDARTLARKVCRSYGVPQAKLVWVDNLGQWAAEWDNGTIKLNSQTHELSHHIHWHLGGDGTEKHEPHGPEFMACHMSVLDTCRIIPIVGMREICKKWKIRFADPGDSNTLTTLQEIALGRHSPAA
jgi:hypothetical protein